jgi:hypothetical protein
MSPQHAPGKQNIQRAQAGHGAAHGRMQQIGNQSGVFVQEEIVIPVSHPGDKDQQHAEQKDVQAKQHAQEGFHRGTA